MDFPLLVVLVLAIAGLACWLATRSGQYAWCAVLGSGAILVLHGRVYFDYHSDDAYITFRYARNLADGVGPVWNRGDHVEGYTNFLWMALLAGVRKVGVDTPFAARWLGFLFSVAAAGGTYALCRKLLPQPSGRIAGVVAALLLAASGPWAVWSMAGLEGAMFAAFLLGAILLQLRERERSSLPLSAGLWAIIAMTRPDGVIFFAVTLAFKLGDTFALARRSDAEDANGGVRRAVIRLILWIATFAALYVPYFVWRYGYYGWLYPNTYYTKVGSGLEQYDRGLQYAATFSREYGAALLLLAPVALAFTSIRRGALSYVAVLLLAWASYVIYIGGDTLLRFRFFQPVLPLFYAVIATSAAALLDNLRSTAPLRAGVRTTTVATLTGGFIAFTLLASANGLASLSLRSETDELTQRQAIGLWLHRELPSTTLVAVIAAGTIPYTSQLPSLDMLGLNDEHIAHQTFPPIRFGAGHEKYDGTYVLDRKPGVIIIFDNLTPAPLGRQSYGYGALSTVLIPAVVDLSLNPRLLQEYEPRAAQLPDKRWINLLVRKGADDVIRKTVAAPP